MSTVYADVTRRPLDAARALAFCSASEHGAIDLFVGRVRNIHLGREVLGISYDLQPALTCKVFADICDEARQRWDGGLRLWLVHRQGHLAVGEASVIAVASARRRDEAFRACRYLVEQMKRRAPIWKQEHYADGDSDWVQGHALCRERDG